MQSTPKGVFPEAQPENEDSLLTLTFSRQGGFPHMTSVHDARLSRQEIHAAQQYGLSYFALTDGGRQARRGGIHEHGQTIEVKPADWRDMWFPEIHGHEGS